MSKIKIAYQDGEFFFVRYESGVRVKLTEKEFEKIKKDNPKLIVGKCSEVISCDDSIIWGRKKY